jgi:photosystem II stability/assembly factor-like uncharacterized protein
VENAAWHENKSAGKTMRMRSRSLALIWLIACVPAVAGVNSWTLQGPYGGNTTAIAFHPTQPNIVLAETWGGLYRSTDGGTTWSMPVRNNVGAVGSIVFDPTQPDAVFFGSDFVYGSTDAGLTFNKLPTPTTRYVNDIAIANDGTLYLADQGGHVFRSDNHGAQWTDITGSWSGFQNAVVADLIVDPNESNRLYAAVPGVGLFRSENRGGMWVAAANPSETYIYSVAVKPGDANRLIIATLGGFFISTDRGDSWTMKGGGTYQPYSYVAFDPVSPANAIALSSAGTVQRSSDAGVTWEPNPAQLKVQYANRVAFTPGTAGRLFVGTTDGPMVSADGGVTFAPRFTGIHASVVAGFASASDGTLYSLQEYGPAGVFRREGNNWLPLGNANLNASIKPQASDIATAPSDASLIYVITIANELVRSIDGGQSWSTPAAEFLSAGAYPQHVVVDSADANVAYAATTWGGLWKTVDRGATWSRVGMSLPTRVDGVGIDPSDSRVIYAGGSNTNGAPVGIFKSLDGGQTWENTGAPPPRAIVGFTFNPADTKTVYAYSGFDALKTSDGGVHWAQLDFGPPAGWNVPAKTVLIDPVIPSTIFVASTPNAAGFLRSVDAGATWETFPFSVPQGEFLFLEEAALDPLQPSRIHVGVHGLGIADYEVAPDLEVTLQGFESSIPVAGTRSAHVRVRNLSGFASSASEVQVTLPDSLTGTALTGCSMVGSVLHCKAGVLLSQATQDFQFSVTASGTPSTGNVRAEVKGHEADPIAANNEAVMTATVATTAPSKSGGTGGGGGGGSFDWLIAAFLGHLFVRRRALERWQAGKAG